MTVKGALKRLFGKKCNDGFLKQSGLTLENIGKVSAPVRYELLEVQASHGAIHVAIDTVHHSRQGDVHVLMPADPSMAGLLNSVADLADLVWERIPSQRNAALIIQSGKNDSLSDAPQHITFNVVDEKRRAEARRHRWTVTPQVYSEPNCDIVTRNALVGYLGDQLELLNFDEMAAKLAADPELSAAYADVQKRTEQGRRDYEAMVRWYEENPLKGDKWP
jgi:hypothetical protein